MNPNKSETNAEATTGKRTRKHYAEAFKTEAVAHCERHGGDIHRTAVELGINPWTLRDWVQEHRRRRRPASPPLDAAGLEAENARLRAELARVTEQRDILKKSLGILSHP
jgi:transposase